MSILPAWIWSGIIGLIIGAIGGGFILIQVIPNPSSNSSSNNTSNPSKPIVINSPPIFPEQKEDLEDLTILVRDSESKQLLKDVKLEITIAEGLIQGRTLDTGTYRFQVPKQKLGEFKVLLNKQNYQQKEIPINFSVNPNEPKLIYLEPTSSITTVKKGDLPFQVSIKSNKEIYTVLEPISVEYSFSGVPKNYRKWITIVKSSVQESSFYSRKYASESGTLLFEGFNIGNYEIRAYIANNNGYNLIERKSIKVE